MAKNSSLAKKFCHDSGRSNFESKSWGAAILRSRTEGPLLKISSSISSTYDWSESSSKRVANGARTKRGEIDWSMGGGGEEPEEGDAEAGSARTNFAVIMCSFAEYRTQCSSVAIKSREMKFVE